MGAKWNRRVRKVDSVQQAIVEGLQRAGVKTYCIAEPCDLLCYVWCRTHQMYCWRTLEVKSLDDTKARKAKVRHDQPDQAQFLTDTQTPVITTITDALLVLSIHTPELQ